MFLAQQGKTRLASRIFSSLMWYTRRDGLQLRTIVKDEGMATVFLLGDSTCANKRMETWPETGWGMCFDSFLAGGWDLDNRAVNGLSTRSAIASGVYGAMLENVCKGDWVVIQFGHNDAKEEERRHTDPWGSYQENLRRMVGEIRAKGGNPVILSSIERRRFDGDDALATHGEYPAAAKAVADELSVRFVPMHELTLQLYQRLGPEGSRRLFNQLPAGTWPNYPEGKEDNTHLSRYGAQSIAGMIATQLRGNVPFIWG